MNTVWILIIALGVLLVLARFTLGAPGAAVATAQEKIKQGARVVDVRTAGEYASGHYAGATNIPLGELQGRLGELGGKTNAVVVYCASGARSASAARILLKAGFTDVTNAGGLSNLKP